MTFLEILGWCKFRLSRNAKVTKLFSRCSREKKKWKKITPASFHQRRKRRCQIRSVLFSFSLSMLSRPSNADNKRDLAWHARDFSMKGTTDTEGGIRVTREQHSSKLHKRAFKLYKFDSCRNFENSFRNFCSASRVLRRINSPVTLYFG